MRTYFNYDLLSIQFQLYKIEALKGICLPTLFIVWTLHAHYPGGTLYHLLKSIICPGECYHVHEFNVHLNNNKILYTGMTGR